MTPELEKYIKDLMIEKLMESPAGDKLLKAAHVLEVFTQHLNAIAEKKDEAGLTGIEVITVMTFTVLQKFAQGKKAGDFKKEDWQEIAAKVSEFAILPDDKTYSVFVFELYALYILKSVENIEGFIPEDTAAAIRALAYELREKAALLNEGEITEVTYIEDCLWISLEAMVKLLASTAYFIPENKNAELVQALSDYAFEYGRMVLFEQERDIITAYLEGQYQLDAALEEKFQAYLDKLQAQAEVFSSLIENAFADDFRTSYLNSIQLALAAGVSEKEILKSTEEIDDFFLVG